MNKRQKKYLFIPSVPTPNGPLHLGHIGGPYLRTDIIARYFRMQGHIAEIVCGNDCYESYVATCAKRENKSYEEVVNAYHMRIKENLSAMNINVCDFVNPLDHKWYDQYRHWHNTILNILQTTSAVVDVNEKMVFDDTTNHYLTGADLHGNCPMCHFEVSGYFCEACGAHFKPEDIIRLDNRMTIHQVSNLFLKMKNSTSQDLSGINNKTKIIYNDFLHKQNFNFRLTTHHPWGIPYRDKQTLFSYGFLYVYFLFLAEIAKPHLQTPFNPFAKSSDVITVSSFGMDNAIPFLASTYGITAYCNEFKPFDHYLMNYFYYLDGKKFSTSKQHAIWVDDIVNVKYDSDIVRLFLASVNVSETIGNFSYAQFNLFYQFISQSLNQVLSTPVKSISESKISQSLQNSYDRFLTQQNKYLSLFDFAPEKAVADIKEWLSQFSHYQNSNDYFFWLKTLSILIYPFMPNKGQLLWQKLQYRDQPHLSSL